MIITNNFDEIENKYYELLCQYIDNGTIKDEHRKELDQYKKTHNLSDKLAQELENIAKIKVASENIDQAESSNKNMGDMNTQMPLSNIKKIVVSCDGGIGASAFGATKLRKVVEKEGLNIEVINFAIFNIESDVDLIITQHQFAELVNESFPDKPLRLLESFMDDNAYINIIEEIKSNM